MHCIALPSFSFGHLLGALSVFRRTARPSFLWLMSAFAATSAV